MKKTLLLWNTNKALRVSIYTLSILFTLSLTFLLGLNVGYHKASFAHGWSEHYEKNLGLERPDSFGGMMRGRLPAPHGSLGTVLSINLPNIVIEDRDGTEKNILIASTTLIKRGMENASSSSIAINNTIIVLGNPNQEGQIEARLIRILPEGMEQPTGTTSPHN